MASFGKDIEEAVETVIGCLPSQAPVDARHLQAFMRRVVAYLEGEGVVFDKDGIIGLTSHIANFVVRARAGVEVDYPSGFEDQVPEGDRILGRAVGKMVTDEEGMQVPAPEILLIASHLAAMRIRREQGW